MDDRKVTSNGAATCEPYYVTSITTRTRSLELIPQYENITPPPRRPLTAPPRSGAGAAECSVCLRGASDGNPLISPCRCGVLRGVHLACHARWMSRKNMESCKFCRTRLTASVVPEYEQVEDSSDLIVSSKYVEPDPKTETDSSFEKSAQYEEIAERTSTSSLNNKCRICHFPGNGDDQLISPCDCDGQVHQRCIQLRIAGSRGEECGSCKVHFNVKISWNPRPWRLMPNLSFHEKISAAAKAIEISMMIFLYYTLYHLPSHPDQKIHSAICMCFITVLSVYHLTSLAIFFYIKWKRLNTEVHVLDHVPMNNDSHSVVERVDSRVNLVTAAKRR